MCNGYVRIDPLFGWFPLDLTFFIQYEKAMAARQCCLQICFKSKYGSRTNFFSLVLNFRDNKVHASGHEKWTPAPNGQSFRSTTTAFFWKPLFELKTNWPISPVRHCQFEKVLAMAKLSGKERIVECVYEWPYVFWEKSSMLAHIERTHSMTFKNECREANRTKYMHFQYVGKQRSLRNGKLLLRFKQTYIKIDNN